MYNLLRSDDILWAGDITGTAQRITLSHVWARKLISSEAFARIFKPGHTYTLSYSGKVIEPVPDTAYREDEFGIWLYSDADNGHLGVNTRAGYSNPPAGYTFRVSKTFTTSDAYPGDVRMLAYSDYSRDESGAVHTGIVEIDDLMIVEGSTPAAWAPAEGETLTADGGGGAMTEPTNLVKTQPDETAIHTVKANVWHKDFLGNALENVKLSATTSCHIGITIKPDKDIPSGHVWSWISYKDDAGAENYANSSRISYVIPAGVWTRLEWTVTVPAGMTLRWSAISIDSLADETNFHATNFAVYPLTGGRIVRARGANDGSQPSGVMTWNGTKGTLKTKEYSVDDVCTIQSDPNLKCINFVFE